MVNRTLTGVKIGVGAFLAWALSRKRAGEEKLPHAAELFFRRVEELGGVRGAPQFKTPAESAGFPARTATTRAA